MSPIAPTRRRPPAIRLLPQRCRAHLGLVVVAGITAATMLGASLVSMEVASARTRLAALDRRIATVQGDRVRLAATFGIRAGPGRLDRLNASALRLRPPASDQYLSGMTALRRLARPEPGMAGAPRLAYDPSIGLGGAVL